jgi:hypothetical protein
MNRAARLFFTRAAALRLLAVLNFAFAAPALPAAPEADSDRDGLSDYLEVHKYRTDPRKADSDGDGIPDGDRAERREFTYTVRSVIRVMHPVNIAAMQDDYQDVRELARTAEYVELEVIHYPFNTLDQLAPCADQESPATLAAALRPGVTTRFDASLNREILTDAARDGLKAPAAWTPVAVRQWAAWLLKRAAATNDFTTYFVHYPAGRPAVLPGLEKAFAAGMSEASASTDAQFDRELWGDSMYRRRIRGTCTSSAVYLATTLRALGLPTRIVLAIPAVDASDPAQVALVENQIRVPAVRNALLTSLRTMGGSFAAHTLNEVYLNGRWRRFNYDTLGENILSASYLGLMTHVNTFYDLADVPLSETWGRRYATRTRSAAFAHANPYATRELSETWGSHCVLDPKLRDRTLLPITRLYWFHSPESPAAIPASTIRSGGKDGHLLMEVTSGFDVLNDAYAAAPKEFSLVAAGHPVLTLRAERGYWGRVCYLRLPAEELARMKPGIRYRLVPVQPVGRETWTVSGDLTISSDSPGAPR